MAIIETKQDSSSPSKLIEICLVILTIIALMGALIYTKSILIPFVFALFLYTIIASGVHYLKNKFNLNKTMAAILSLVIVTITTGLTTFFVAISVQSFVKTAHNYNSRMIVIIDWATKLLEKFGYELNSGFLKQKFTELPLLEIAQSLTGDLFSFLGNLALVLIFTLFLGIGGTKSNRDNKTLIEFKNSISKYIFLKWLTSLIGAFIVWIILLIADVELAFMFAWLAFILNFIPNIGSILATFLPLPIIILQYGLGWQLWFVLGTSVGAQFVLGSLLEPKLFGESIDLHPITILICLMFWGLVWGIPGMFLAVPVTGALKIIFSKIGTTKPIAEIMAGRIS